MHIHFIAIGGSIMHALAVNLHKEGYRVTGSDDQIFDPAKSNLMKAGLLPEEEGWHPDKIDKGVDAVILGMHAKPDNPELLKARELGIKIYSFPEFIARVSAHKKKVVIAGSHGKTTVTSMIMHVLKAEGLAFDYLTGSSVAGFDSNVALSRNNDLMVLEGDEYISSALDDRPKFLWYNPQLAVITGIAWDHINIFKTFEAYLEAFVQFLKSMPAGAKLIYNQNDPHVIQLVEQHGRNLTCIPYGLPEYEMHAGIVYRINEGKKVPLKIMGTHNLLNMSAAIAVCRSLDIDSNTAMKSLCDFEGAGKRMELVGQNTDLMIFRDFAHAPSKVKAALNGMREQHVNKEICLVFEFHTYSSLDPEFIQLYKGVFEGADHLYFFFDKQALAIKDKELPSADLLSGLASGPVKVLQDKEMLLDALKRHIQNDGNDCLWIFMSSGHFGGTSMDEIREILLADPEQY